jgi:hypothetical protein
VTYLHDNPHLSYLANLRANEERRIPGLLNEFFDALEGGVSPDPFLKRLVSQSVELSYLKGCDFKEALRTCLNWHNVPENAPARGALLAFAEFFEKEFKNGEGAAFLKQYETQVARDVHCYGQASPPPVAPAPAVPTPAPAPSAPELKKEAGWAERFLTPKKLGVAAALLGTAGAAYWVLREQDHARQQAHTPPQDGRFPS